MSRLNTTSGELVRRGFVRAQQAAAVLTRLEGRRPAPAWRQDKDWMQVFETLCDPDLALSALDRLDESAPALLDDLARDPRALERLLVVLGGSQALAQFLCIHPDQIRVLAEEPVRTPRELVRCRIAEAIGVADLDDVTSVADAPGAADALRIANKLALVRIAARDLTSSEPMGQLESIAAELSDLADAIVAGALAIARSKVSDHRRVRYGVVAMGKCGAQELNYISDIDVIHVAEPADEETSAEEAVGIAGRLAAALSRICSAHSAAGSIWQVDSNLRPDGKNGPLVRTLSSMQSYYDKWAKNWEFQAMLKARPMAGDLDLAADFCAIVAPKTWQAAERENFLAETQAMRQRVIDLLPAREAAREIKLGAGGLRDVEFTVQLLQLVHGRADDRLHLRATLPALQALVDAGYIGRGHGAEMAEAYRFERTLEHRIQLFKLRRTHLLPSDEPTLRVIARGLGMRTAEELTTRWREVSRLVRSLHQQVFYSPLLAAVSRIPTEGLRLTPEQAGARLRVLGFSDPSAALRHIEALTTGTNRATEIQRQLMPAMLGWIAEGPNPDHGLLSFRQVSEALGQSPWYLRAMRDEGQMAERLARLLSSSRYGVDLLKRNPETVRMLADDSELTPRSLADLTTSMSRAGARHDTAEDAVAAIRAMRRAELLRLVVGEVSGVIGLAELGRGLSDLAGATIDAALQVAAREIEDPPRLGVLALGRWGGGEMSLGSDCDAIFVLADSDDPEAVRKAEKMVSRVRQMLAQRGPDPALPIDADLRPEGKSGPMVRTLSSMRAYYERWSVTWEKQALVRASHGAGDPEVTAEVLSLVDPLRWPEGGLQPKELADIRKLKARMETERIPRGTNPRKNVKLGPGGLSDVEWTVQLVQLQNAGRLPALRTPSTLDALHAEVAAGLVGAEDAAALEEAWRMASRIRNTIVLVRSRASDTFPTDSREVEAIATLMGYGRGKASTLLDDWLRCARRASAVAEDVFWGRS